ncbi:alpha/beta fold hydrolase [Peribacillus sp. SCS-26]|uniref:alpha/beta fold hydrolase n=1 Tax=Paraperibacillus marinus TaxID=3115295 RepID=UPI003906B77E
MKREDGEHRPRFNGIAHWVKVEGSSHGTVPLFILHGGPGGNHYTFERTAGRLLARSRTVVYYVQRGCGRSEAPASEEDYSISLLTQDFLELISWLGAEKVDLLGYSFGGELALEFASSLGERIHTIILSGPSLIKSDTNKLVQLAGFLSVADRHLAERIRRILNDPHSISEAYDKVWEIADAHTVDSLLFEDQEIAKKNRALWDESGLINTGLMARAVTRDPALPLQHRLRGILHRTLIITGAFDRNTGIPISKIIHDALPDSRLVIFNKSAHFPDLEETDRFIREIINFLD